MVEGFDTVGTHRPIGHQQQQGTDCHRERSTHAYGMEMEELTDSGVKSRLFFQFGVDWAFLKDV